MQTYSHLSADERSQIEILNRKGYSQHDIALALGRNSGKPESAVRARSTAIVLRINYSFMRWAPMLPEGMRIHKGYALCTTKQQQLDPKI